jgi:hypothetical protein
MGSAGIRTRGLSHLEDSKESRYGNPKRHFSAVSYWSEQVVTVNTNIIPLDH